MPYLGLISWPGIDRRVRRVGGGGSCRDSLRHICEVVVVVVRAEACPSHPHCHYALVATMTWDDGMMTMTLLYHHLQLTLKH
ncbi:hypothetical protein ACHAXH_006877 [Discostella pseudostelligera]